MTTKQPGHNDQMVATSPSATHRQGLLPFVICAVAAVATLALPPYGNEWGHIAVAALLLLVIYAGELRFYRRTWWEPVPPFLFFVVVIILRDGSGGSTSGLGALVMLPILWVAMYGNRQQMVLAVVATVSVFVLPILVFGPPEYTTADWRRALVWGIVAGTVGPAVQALVSRLHEREQHQAELASSLQDALTEVTLTSQRWRALLDHLPDTSVFSIDRDLRHTDAFGAGLDDVGMTTATGKTLYETSSPENIAKLEPVYRAGLDGDEASIEFTASNADRRIELTSVPLPLEGHRDEALIVARDVTESRQREHQLAMAKERLASLFEEAPFGVIVCAVDGRVVDVNPAACQLTGRIRDALVSGYSFPFGAEPSDVERLVEEILASPSGRVAAETRIQHQDGHWVDVAFEGIVMHDRDGNPKDLLFNAVDVSERRRFEAQLAHLAEHDPLTGLANRRRFDQELERHLDLCERYGARGALMMMDLDHFKEVNDTLGHGAGDQLIMSVAELLRMRMRRSDLVARLGGDEFAILLPEADRASAENVARDIVALVAEKASFLDGSRPRRLTASIGVVLIERAGISASQLVSTADMTMYDAKEAGRNRFVILDTKDFAVPRSATQLAWGQRISDAIADKRLVLHAQPIYGIAEGAVVGAELLLRLRDEHGALVMPGRFLYIAERLGLVTPLDRWVAGEAVELLTKLKRINPRFHVEVNLSAHSVGDPDLADHLVDLVTSNDIDSTKLVFELTETAAVANIETAREFADRLGRLGCRFALDDFGAGFGSFYYLKHLPFDFVKIDGEFVEKSPVNFTDRLILSSIVDIARGLGKKTIAEFVASPDIQQVCIDQGVDYLQGYHVGRPAPMVEVLAWAAGKSANGIPADAADTPPRVPQR
jgi:diguanylate cyclase (GGDEF)-like protein/PAS domain S-box-containing protein